MFGVVAGELVVLVNPAARGGRTLRMLDPVVRRLREGERPVSVIMGTTPEDALERACMAVAEEPEALVAFGGDGLVHLALQAVAGTDVPLGIIPAGTGNDIADALGIPKQDPVAAAGIVAAGVVRDVDAGRVGGEEWFAGVMACGFDSRVNERANRMTRPPGMARYLLAMVQELREFRPLPFRITVDGETREFGGMLVAVANTRSYGAGMRVCPHARPDDGLLDVTIVEEMSTAAFLRIFPSVYRGGHLGRPGVVTLRGKEITVAAPGVVAYADGERLGPLPLTCAVHPGALRVLAPAGF